MNKIVWIVPVLIIIIAISGCTYQDIGPGVEKTYKGNGVSFNYPHEYEIKNVSNESGVFVEGKSNWDSDFTFQISEESLDNIGKINGMSLDDLRNTDRLTQANYTVEEVQNITIDNIHGLDMIYAHYNPPYVKYESIFFQKNMKRYNILFEYQGVGVTDTRAVVAITNSFKVLS